MQVEITTLSTCHDDCPYFRMEISEVQRADGLIHSEYCCKNIKVCRQKEEDIKQMILFSVAINSGDEFIKEIKEWAEE